MKHKKWIALLLAAVLALGAMSVTAFAAESAEPEAEASTEAQAAKPCRGKHSRKDKLAEPENAIGKDAAKERALADAGVNAEDVGKVKARVTALEDGTVVYRVSFTAGDLWYRYKLDAVTGEILDKTTEYAAAHEAAKAARKDRSENTSETAEDGSESAAHAHRHGRKHSTNDSAAPTAEADAAPTAEAGNPL